MRARFDSGLREGKPSPFRQLYEPEHLVNNDKLRLLQVPAVQRVLARFVLVSLVVVDILQSHGTVRDTLQSLNSGGQCIGHALSLPVRSGRVDEKAPHVVTRKGLLLNTPLIITLEGNGSSLVGIGSVVKQEVLLFQIAFGMGRFHVVRRIGLVRQRRGFSYSSIVPLSALINASRSHQ